MTSDKSGILHEFNDSVFDALGGEHWETDFRLYSRITDKEINHMSYEESVLDDEQQYRFRCWFVSQQVQKRDGPIAIDARDLYIMRINVLKYPIGKTFEIGDKLARVDDGTIFRITKKILVSRWTNINRYIVEEAV